MPSEKSARAAQRKRLRNRIIRTATRSSVARAVALIQGDDLPGAQEAVNEALVALDRAARKGVIHPNNAARRKSRLLAKLNALKSRAAYEGPSFQEA